MNLLESERARVPGELKLAMFRIAQAALSNVALHSKASAEAAALAAAQAIDSAATSPLNTCYPAAVNYTPTYYLINGHGFDRTNAVANAISVGSNDSTGNILLRFVNAGLRHAHAVRGRPADVADRRGQLAAARCGVGVHQGNVRLGARPDDPIVAETGWVVP